MEKYWSVRASFARKGERVKVTAFGPAPRIYEALGNAKCAIAMAYPDGEVDNIDILSAVGVNDDFSTDKEWRVLPD